jgi:hypothetical protein
MAGSAFNVLTASEWLPRRPGYGWWNGPTGHSKRAMKEEAMNPPINRENLRDTTNRGRDWQRGRFVVERLLTALLSATRTAAQLAP